MVLQGRREEVTGSAQANLPCKQGPESQMVNGKVGSYFYLFSDARG